MNKIEPERMSSKEVNDGNILSAKIAEKSVFFKNAVKKETDEKQKYPRKKRKVVARRKGGRRQSEVGGKIVCVEKIGQSKKGIPKKERCPSSIS